VSVSDPIALEVLRARLESVAEQAALAIEHTAVSPAVTESKDYSVTLMDADGNLVVGAGTVLYHFAAASYSVRATIARHGATIRPGDVFIANDPHQGGGLHPQDVMIQRPIFAGDRRIGWVGVSAHMMDMGGMVVGSFAPAATECYQEALRVPAVRLFREGVEVTEVWDIFRTNLRMAQLVEMDLRGLVAGAHFADAHLAALVDEVGVDRFTARLGAIRDLTEAEMRRRIAGIADGTYRWTSWTEFGETFYEVPCTLTVAGDRMVFDFAGAAPQTDHFFNSKPYIIASELGVMMWLLMASDLPYNDGMLAVFEVRCPERSIVDAAPPAPIGAAHMHVGLNAATVALTTLALALAASPDAPARAYVSGTGGDSGIGNQVWSWTGPDGTIEVLPVHTSGARLEAGDRYEIRLPCAGGFGDPLDRDPDAVAHDLRAGRFGPDEARTAYGVVVDPGGGVDVDATVAARAARRRARLAAAAPAARPYAGPAPDAGAVPLPLYPGVVQRGRVAVAEASGTPLAVAPDHWTDGCPVLTEDRWGAAGPAVTVRTYLDPTTGTALHVEAVVGDAPRSFLVAPDRWSGGPA
jgi:N-methylhydantoinase B/oxoprolinase/acetone carboxylase alpha subunit